MIEYESHHEDCDNVYACTTCPSGTEQKGDPDILECPICHNSTWAFRRWECARKCKVQS